MKIHANKQAALAALEEYKRELSTLIERTGVCERCVDESSGVYAEVIFMSDDGKTVCRYSE